METRRSSCIFLLLLAAVQLSSQCEVEVSAPPWPNPLFIPQGSTLILSCTATENVTSPFWAIDLSGDTVSELQFSDNGRQRDQLNSHGVYELPSLESQGMPLTLRLQMNDTERNNQTEIKCTGFNLPIDTTSLFVYETSPVTLEALDVDRLRSSNISWSSLIPSLNLDMYMLAVSTDSQEWTIPLREPYHVFTAPEDAPPCEVYNFSVTATYVGATYTGAGCSVPSPVLSTMLPSLPDIKRLELSLNHSLEKQSGEVTLTVYFEPADYCQDYPLTNYTLEIELASTGMYIMSEGNFVVATNLSENEVYTYRLGASNSVGTVWTTNSVQIYTTDVQNVRVEELESVNSVLVQCTFIPGSDATGCMVVFVGELTNTTVNLTRMDNEIESVINHTLPFPLSCYHQVFALDIESDGSLGTLPVPGVLVIHSTDQTCQTTDEKKSQSSSSLWIIILGVVVLSLLVLMVAVVAVLSIYCLKRSHQSTKTFSAQFSTSISFDASSPTQQTAMPIYAQPNKDKKSKEEERTAGDGTENDCVQVEVSDLDNGAVPEREMVTENVRVIEPSNEQDYGGDAISIDPDAPELPPRFEPGTSTQLAFIQQDYGGDTISIDPDAPELPPPFEPGTPTSEAPPAYGQINDDYQAAITDDEPASESSIIEPDQSHAADNNFDVVTSPKLLGPIYQDIVEASNSQDVAMQHSHEEQCHVVISTPDLNLESVRQQSAEPLPFYQEVRELRVRQVISDDHLLRRESPDISISSSDRQSPSQWRTHNVNTSHVLNEYTDFPVTGTESTPPPRFTEHPQQIELVSPVPRTTPVRHDYTNVSYGGVIEEEWLRAGERWNNHRIPPGGTLV